MEIFLRQGERTRWLALRCSVALKACVQSCLCYIQSQPKAKVSHADQVKHQQLGNVYVPLSGGLIIGTTAGENFYKPSVISYKERIGRKSKTFDSTFITKSALSLVSVMMCTCLRQAMAFSLSGNLLETRHDS